MDRLKRRQERVEGKKGVRGGMEGRGQVYNSCVVMKSEMCEVNNEDMSKLMSSL